MKKIIYSFVLVVMVLFSSCDDISSYDDSKVTYYAAFKIKGDEIMQVTVNTSFVDPGVQATINGVDVTNRIVIDGDVNASKIGLYELTYSVTNDDGYTTSTKRTVIVCDPSITADMSGDYKTVAGTFRDRGGVITNYPGFSVIIKKVAPGFFSVSDFFGGYYDQRAKYGSKYAESGYVQLKADNSLVLLSCVTLPWGDTITSLDNGVYDPSTSSVSWAAQYAGMTFNVVLN